MDKNNDEIEKILSSADKVERLPPKPFFYTRLVARMEKKRETITRAEWAWSMVMACILVILNIYILTDYGDVEDLTDNTEDPIELLSEEYTLNAFDIYDDQQLQEIEEDDAY